MKGSSETKPKVQLLKFYFQTSQDLSIAAYMRSSKELLWRYSAASRYVPCTINTTLILPCFFPTSQLAS